MKLFFTPLQMEIVKHRLEMPDCIAECLPQYAAEDVELICDLLMPTIRDDALMDTREACQHSLSITKNVLRDCVEGSTFHASAVSDNQSPERLAAIMRAAVKVAEIIGYWIGEELDYPAS